MIFQTFQTLNATTLQEVFRFPTIDTPIFWPVILFAIFLVFGFGMFFREIVRERQGNIISSFAVSGFVTTAIAFVMSLMGIIQRQTVVMTLVIASVFIVIFLLTGKD